jgi:hypothetical protein
VIRDFFTPFRHKSSGDNRAGVPAVWIYDGDPAEQAPDVRAADNDRHEWSMAVRNRRTPLRGPSAPNHDR